MRLLKVPSWRSSFALLAVLTWVAAAPAGVHADSGSITNVHETGSGYVQATFSVTADDCAAVYCGWFPLATQVAASTPCTTSGIVFVGSLEGPGTQTADETFRKVFDPVKLCLYLYRNSVYQPVAETTYASPPPPPVLGPTLLSPEPGAHVVAAGSVAFRVRSPAISDFVTIDISRAPTVAADGTLAEVLETKFASAESDGTRTATFSASWTRTPGVYYWQAHRLACNPTVTDCEAESEVRTLQVVPPPFAFTATARGRQQLRGPRLTKFNNLVLSLSCNRSCGVTLRGTPSFRRGGRQQRLRGLGARGDISLQGGTTTSYGFFFTTAERARLARVIDANGPVLWQMKLSARSSTGEVMSVRRSIRMTASPLPRPTPAPPKAPPPPPNPAPPKVPPSRPACDSSYPTVCIPPYPPDLDCGDIPYSDFSVVGRDPHGFDGDDDGVGCES